MIIGLHHPGIVVPDLAKAIEFYCEVLEFKVFKKMEWQAPSPIMDQITGLTHSSAKVCLLKGPNCYLELFEFKSNSSASSQTAYDADKLGLRHLAFQVSDVAAVLSKLQACGGQVMNQPATVKGGGTGVYSRDPFGNLIEFTTAKGRFPSL
ncbi:MAG: glyoxalase [Robiginitomaculum sp.]|nr:MAG: glyoxalase [Robiginitomaculum sp.]